MEPSLEELIKELQEIKDRFDLLEDGYNYQRLVAKEYKSAFRTACYNLSRLTGKNAGDIEQGILNNDLDYYY